MCIIKECITTLRKNIDKIDDIDEEYCECNLCFSFKGILSRCNRGFR